MTQASALSAREVCQRLRDAALGIHLLQRIEVANAGDQVLVDIAGWCLLLDLDGPRLLHCLCCTTVEGRQWRLDNRQRFGTDPVSLLSTWELARIEQLLGTTI
ncbi:MULTISPECIES: hypothetical protein [unclassified Pseudomonas]|uniref:DUF7693 family protein n=1 Tax=unclassified Pseudomonas TaxID=196821 RepID=UPI000839931A|nr:MULTISPECIES: hypothetical protein [unclassified Pseudomonas]QIH08177.1 hypothetical protein ATY02_16435 [Pseudomonas sp. BIOMIG1BAC]